MEEFDSQFNQIFNELTKTLVEDYRFNNKLVTKRVDRFKRFAIKADKVYFNFIKSCFDDFLNEEEKIHNEISSNLNEDEELTESILEIVSDIEETIEDTKKIIIKSRELSQGIDTINKRIQSFEKIQVTMKNLNETMVKCQKIIPMDVQQNAMVVEEM